MGSMYVTLNPDARPEEQWPYYTHKVREEIGNTLITLVPQVRPATTKLLREILGHMGYYRKSSRGYALITELLKTLLKHDISFNWDDVRQESFEKLRSRLIATPILTSPDKATIFHKDTSGITHEVGHM